MCILYGYVSIVHNGICISGGEKKYSFGMGKSTSGRSEE
jgi:hypothetical protein